MSTDVYDPTDDAVAFITAALASASTDRISPTSWWPRAVSALEAAAASSDAWPHFVATTLRKLQVESPSALTSEVIARLRVRMDEQGTFEAMRHLCQADATYIVALARASKDEKKAARAASKASPAIEAITNSVEPTETLEF